MQAFRLKINSPVKLLKKECKWKEIIEKTLGEDENNNVSLADLEDMDIKSQKPLIKIDDSYDGHVIKLFLKKIFYLYVIKII